MLGARYVHADQSVSPVTMMSDHARYLVGERGVQTNNEQYTNVRLHSLW